MAEQSNGNGTNNSYNRGLNKQLGSSYIGEGWWTHARNAANNSIDGQEGFLGNEPANFSCLTYPLPYLIGAIPLEGDEWVLFFTDNTNSEIGTFLQNTCAYTKVVNSPCLGFNNQNLITGASRRTFDCSFNVYWDDGLNPSRVLDINNVPWIQIATTVGGCTTYTNTTELDCEKLRLAPLLTIPNLSLSASQGSGTLPNGTYQVVIAFAVNGIKVTDYLIQSNLQSTFNHNNDAGAVKLDLSWPDNTVDPNFDEMQVVVISSVNGQTVAKDFGIYDIRQSTIYIDNINPSLKTVPLELIPLQTPPIEKSDAMYKIGDKLLRVGIYTKPDINYQPLANLITVKWVLAEYVDTYYNKGGNNVGYLRDENYVFFIRWVYNTGDKSADYTIPGRAYRTSDAAWATVNTASVTALLSTPTGDGGTFIAEGDMGYMQTDQIYPDDQPAIWGSLCGQNIRLHKFPDQTVDPILTHFTSGNTIRILGVRFDNITAPQDLNGNPLTDVVGYEILRGSREGNRTIIAKGILNNMRSYTDPGTGEKALYQNYPYNDLRADYYLTSDQSIINTGTKDNNRNSPLTGYMNNMFSFHSPDTNFRHPFVGGDSSVKVYQEVDGYTVGKFETPYQHPKFRVLTDFDSYITDIVGALSTAIDVLALLGGTPPDISLTGTEDLPFSSSIFVPIDYPDGDILGTSTISTVYGFAATALNAAMWLTIAPIKLKIIQQQFLNSIKGLIPAEQFAAQYNSHGFYNNPVFLGAGVGGNVLDYQYVKDHLQTFGGFNVNNLYRNDYVAVWLDTALPEPSLQDDSRYTLYDNGNDFSDEQVHNTSALYGAIKISIPSQYGQVGAVMQVPISGTIIPTNPDLGNYPSPVLFGGDTYINRYTEKNPFFFFNDWLRDQPDDVEYDYRNYINVPYPRYWIDNTKVYSDFLALAENYRHLDDRDSSTFYVKQGYFYLFCNGVRDFYVESDVNVGYRDWEDEIPKRFYDPYGFMDIDYMFRSDYIKAGNYYKYDYSLSAGYFFNQYISWGQTLDRDYDPTLAATCLDYYPRRVMYSLPQREELKKDNWRCFLINNKDDYSDQITAIKEIGKSGALILFQDDTPVMLMGADSLQSEGGTNITVGDGKLFSQPLQVLSNVDSALHYGSCQNRLSIVSTPYGVFWVSQDAGKIFQYSGQLVDIAKGGLKYWLAQYLPSQLLLQFPDYKLIDNPVAGIGVQTVYDTTNEILYICKKDYIVKPGVCVSFNSLTNTFYTLGYPTCPQGFSLADNLQGCPLCVNNAHPTNTIPAKGVPITIQLGDPNYFQDCSWTISYDLKERMFISMHDWHPDYVMSTKGHILTSKSGQLWRHNERCDLFCNFYGTDYPFEIEYVANTGTNVTTIKGIEYVLESYYYQNNCWDKYQAVDENFTNAVVHNDEQNSGWLALVPKPWNNPWLVNTYPIPGANNTSILYSKKEQKYRFNQFKDLTNDRGMFSGATVNMFITDPNGYTFTINPAYINYAKPPFQQKKFRNYVNKVFLQRVVSGKAKMIMKFSNTKNQQSPR